MGNRYIDLNRLCKWLENLKSGFTKEELVFRDELIEHLQGNNGIHNVLPTVDVVEVVRCKDCKYHREAHYEDEGEPPYIKHVCELYKRTMQLDDFCSYGKRKV